MSDELDAARILRASETIEQAVRNLDGHLFEHRRAMDVWLQRFEELTVRNEEAGRAAAPPPVVPPREATLEGQHFCRECDCIAGNGQRGHHMAFAGRGGGPSSPLVCAFCSHESTPVAKAHAFLPPAEPPQPSGEQRCSEPQMYKPCDLPVLPGESKCAVHVGARASRSTREAP